jgi:hypothetical protein
VSLKTAAWQHFMKPFRYLLTQVKVPYRMMVNAS